MDPITVHAHLLPEVTAALEKLCRKAEKLGCDKPVLKVGPVRILTKGAGKKRVDYPVHDITVEGAPVRLPGGWDFVAHLEREGDANLVFVQPGKVLEERFRTTDTACHHCRTNRYRRHLYVFQNEAGEQVQVGKNCLRDFFGADPAQVALMASFEKTVRGIEDESWGGGFGKRANSLKEIIAYTSAVIEHEGGYVSGRAASDAGTVSTSALVSEAMYPNLRDREECKYAATIRTLLSDDRYEEAERCIEWVLNDWRNDSDYAHNLKVIAANPMFYNWKALGFALSMYPTWQRELGRLKERELAAKVQAEQAKASAFVGQPKERLRDMRVACIVAAFIRSTEWGDTYLYKFQDEAGNIFGWFTSPAGIKVGEEGTLTGTVKSHDDYKGAKQTMLARCVWKRTKGLED